MAFIAVGFMILSLLSLIWMGGGVTALIALLFAVGLLAEPFVTPFLGKMLQKTKIGAKVKTVYIGVCIGGFLICALLGREKEVEHPLTEYRDTVSQIREEMRDGKYQKAQKDLEKLFKSGMEDDELYTIQAKLNIERGDLEEAQAQLEKGSEVKIPDYYCVMADLYSAQGKPVSEQAAVLKEGADRYPDSGILNYRAGCLQASLQNFTQADYYLQRAVARSADSDPYSPYMLGYVRFVLGDKETAYQMIALAEKCGILDQDGYEIGDLTNWYLAEKEKREEESKSK